MTQKRSPHACASGRLSELTLLIASLAVVFSCGCRVGPDFFDPGVQVEHKWREYEKVGVDSLQPKLWYWWREFDDPILLELVNQASYENLQVREAYYRVLEARAQRGVVRGELFPSVDGIGAYDFRRSSANGSPFVPISPGSYDFFTIGFDASWEIDVWGRVRRSVEAADAGIEVTQDDYDTLLTTLITDVAATYVDLRLAQERVRVAQRNSALQQRTLEVARGRFRAGLVGELDVAQAATNLHTTQSSIPLLERDVQRAVNRLCVLCGEPPHDILAELGDKGGIPQLRGDVSVGFPADILRSRPDVRAAELKVAVQSARIGVAVADLYPRFTLNGAISVDSTTVSTLFETGSISHNLGPSFNWNILSFGRILYNIQAHRERYEQSVASYQQTVLQATEEVENALVAYVRERDRLRQLDQAVAQGERAVRFAQQRYERGLVSFQSVVDTQRSFFVLQEQQVISRANVTLHRIALYKALGGGWSEQFFTQDTLVEHTDPAEHLMTPLIVDHDVQNGRVHPLEPVRLPVPDKQSN